MTFIYYVYKYYVGQALCTGLPPLRVGAIDCPHTRGGKPAQYIREEK